MLTSIFKYPEIPIFFVYVVNGMLLWALEFKGSTYGGIATGYKPSYVKGYITSSWGELILAEVFAPVTLFLYLVLALQWVVQHGGRVAARFFVVGGAGIYRNFRKSWLREHYQTMERLS